MNPQLDPRSVTSLQLVYGAIMLGALGFGVIVLVVKTQGWMSAADDAMLRYLGWGAAGSIAVFAPLAYVLRDALLKRAAGRNEAIRLEATRAAWLLFAALLEGCCLFNLVVWLLSGEAIVNGLTAMLAWAMMAASFPTRDRLEAK